MPMCPSATGTRALEKLKQVGLGERAEHQPSQLSGGSSSASRLRALVNNPALILADEPTGALDSRTSVEIMALLQQLNTGGMTIVLVTHEQDVAAFASREVHFATARSSAMNGNTALGAQRTSPSLI